MRKTRKMKAPLSRISKNVKYERKGRSTAFTLKLEKLKTGESFVIEAQVISLYRSSASLWGKRNHRQFSILKEGDFHRCYRIA